jgi:hypothetical protein
MAHLRKMLLEAIELAYCKSFYFNLYLRNNCFFRTLFHDARITEFFLLHRHKCIKLVFFSAWRTCAKIVLTYHSEPKHAEVLVNVPVYRACASVA